MGIGPRKTCWETGHLGSTLGPRWKSTVLVVGGTSSTTSWGSSLARGEGLAARRARVTGEASPGSLVVEEVLLLTILLQLVGPGPEDWTGSGTQVVDMDLWSLGLFMLRMDPILSRACCCFISGGLGF